MCFDTDSLPPIPVLAAARSTHEDLVLESGDGARFAAFAALPDEPSSAGVVILPDVRGLYRFYEELALRFARARLRGRRDRLLRPHRRRREARRRLRVHAARRADDAGRRAGRRRRSGRVAARARRHVDLHRRLLHGRPPLVARGRGRPRPERSGRLLRPSGRRTRRRAGPAQVADRIEAPILALQAGADQNITAEDNAAFRSALESAGVEHELIEYEGAPHSFFDRKQADYADASADAWQRTLDFIEAHRS